VQSRHLQGAHYPCLPELHFVKIVIYGSSVYDYISGDVVVDSPSPPPQEPKCTNMNCSWRC